MTRISLHDLLQDESEDVERKEVATENIKSNRKFSHVTFLTRFDGFSRYCSIPIEGAKKLTLKQFVRYMVGTS